MVDELGVLQRVTAIAARPHIPDYQNFLDEFFASIGIWNCLCLNIQDLATPSTSVHRVACDLNTGQAHWGVETVHLGLGGSLRPKQAPPINAAARALSRRATEAMSTPRPTAALGRQLWPRRCMPSQVGMVLSPSSAILICSRRRSIEPRQRQRSYAPATSSRFNEAPQGHRVGAQLRGLGARVPLGAGRWRISVDIGSRPSAAACKTACNRNPRSARKRDPYSDARAAMRVPLS